MEGRGPLYFCLRIYAHVEGGRKRKIIKDVQT